MNGSGNKVYWVKNLRCAENVDWREVMIKCEVVFDGDVITVKSFYEIRVEVSACDVYIDHVYVDTFNTVEQAIQYCMEN